MNFYHDVIMQIVLEILSVATTPCFGRKKGQEPLRTRKQNFPLIMEVLECLDTKTILIEPSFAVLPSSGNKFSFMYYLCSFSSNRRKNCFINYNGFLFNFLLKL